MRTKKEMQMDSVIGHIKNGRVELDAPLPSDWAEGSRISLTKAESSEPIDITGDSPEAIEAWIAYYDNLHAQIVGSTFPEQLERILAEAKDEELATREAYDRKIRGLFP
jgi:hypothetical protein